MSYPNWIKYNGENLSTDNNIVDKYIIQRLEPKTEIETIEIGYFVLDHFMDTISGQDITDEVVAYMPLPAPYKARG